NNSTIESLIREESKIYRDIIQDDFPESYGNVYLKTLMAWKWSLEFCANVEYVMVLNDELFVDQFKLVSFLHYDLSQVDYDNHFALCYCLGGKKSEHNKYKRFRDLGQKMLYQGKYYPKFCHGVGYVAHISVIRKLYLASLQNKMLMPDDVWNGVLAEKLGIALNCRNELFHVTRSYRSLLKTYLQSPLLVSICDQFRPMPTAPCMRQMYDSIYKLRSDSKVRYRFE
ncbi:beta-1,3-galactosyltransferase 1, partial [Octopus bimaculoides]